jgi:hypothetical protein
MHELHVHIRGRADATIQVLTGAAVLKRHNRLPVAGAVTVTGARWQDWRGTRESPRAHRFPCNPQIGGVSLPDLVANARLRMLLLEPLAVTDPLPFHVNYADRLFEELGGIEAARAAVEYVASNQKVNAAAVDRALVEHAWRTIAFPGYVGAYQNVQRELDGRVNQESAIGLHDRIAQFRPNAPTDNIEAVQDVAGDALRSTILVSSPPLLSPEGFSYWVAKLEAAA